MTTLNRLVVQWGGPMVVGSSVSVLHYSASDNSAPPCAAVLAAFNGLASLFPSGLTITVPNSGDKIDDTTGVLTGVWAGSGGGTMTATGAAGAAAPAGAVVSWLTGGIVKGRRLRGRTFLVPVTTFAFDSTGHLGPATVTAIQTWANAMQASGPLAVWHRPTTKGGSDGNSYGVTSTRVRNKVAVLRSRRD